MSEKKSIAVVLFEDNDEEIIKARKVVAYAEEAIIVTIAYKTLEDAGFFFGRRFQLSHPDPGDICHLRDLKESATISKGFFELAILTDLYLPSSFGGQEEPTGVVIATAARAKGLPVVVCTGGHHPHSHWAESILRLLDIPVVYDKNWERALELLREQVEAQSL